MMRKLKLYTLFVVALIAGYVCWINNQEVQVNFPWPLSYSTNTPAFVVYLIAFAAGSICTGLLLGIAYTKKSYQVRKLTKELDKYTAANELPSESLEP